MLSTRERANIVRKFRGKRALVIGDSMLDGYLEGTASRLSPEGPVPVVKVEREVLLPGGAANTAANVCSLGAEPVLLSVVGDDQAGHILGRCLDGLNVSSDHLVVDPGRRTTTKSRVVADSQCLLRLDEEDVFDLDRDVESEFRRRLRHLFPTCDVVIVSDYVKGVLTPAVVSELARLNRDQGKLVVVDSKDLTRHRFRNVSVITPNHLDAQRACASRVRLPANQPTSQHLESLGRELLRKIHTQWVIMTVGASGALLFQRDRPTYHMRARQVHNAQIAGAGDTFTAALGLALSCRIPTRMAVEIANEAAAIAVGKRHTASVSQQELVQRLSLALQKPTTSREIVKEVRRCKQEGRRIVFASGTFDSLHSGHVGYLQEAKRLGDVLVVGVNSDRSLLHLDRHRQPAKCEEDRLCLVAALGPVDYALLFDEETPERLMREIQPDVYVRSGDLRSDPLLQDDTAGEIAAQVVTVPLLEPKSSPDMLETTVELSVASS